MNFLYLNYPSWIHPEVFPGVPVLQMIRWYGLMYIFAFGTAFLVLRKVKKEGALDTPGYKASDDDIFSFITWGIIFLLLGARIFSTLVYNTDTSISYWKKPWLIFWPFKNGKFTGLAGMSYHGGFIGGLIGMILWCVVHKKSSLKWIDAMCLAIPLGYTFGRLGNFMNGELYGRITTMPWGVCFPDAEPFSAKQQWVQDFASNCGMSVDSTSGFVNLPRHPSQLYEALFEGVLLWTVLWLLRKHKPFDGFFAGLYTIGYGFVRFVIEYFREPDKGIGYRIGNKSAELYTNTSLLNISTGQILCFLMMLGGAGIIIVSWYLNKKKTGLQDSSRKQIKEKKTKKNK